MTADPGSPPSSEQELVGGRLNAAISRAMVRIQRDYLGRGPTTVHTSLRDNTLLIVMEDILTKAERSLVQDGKAEEVLRTRASFQMTMKADIVAAVTELTGRNVVAFMSTNHVEPDLACEVLVLESADGDAIPRSGVEPDD